MNINDLTGPALDQYIAVCLGHVGPSPLAFHCSGDIALQLYDRYGHSIVKYADGFHATMRHGGKVFTCVGLDPITAIYRAFIVSRLGENLEP